MSAQSSTLHARRHYYARARQLAARHGTRTAAEFLRGVGFPLESALALLATPNHAKTAHLSCL